MILKIQTNQTLFVVDGDTLTVCRNDQPLLRMPLEDVAAFAKQLEKEVAQPAPALAVYEAQAKRVVDEAMDAAVMACLKGEPLSEEAMRQTLAPLHELGRVLRLALVRNDQAT